MSNHSYDEWRNRPAISRNTDSQDELRELMMTALDAYESTDMQLDDIVNEWVKRFNAHTQKAVEVAEERTADIEFKAGINHATMSGEYVTKAELEKAVTEARKDQIMIDAIKYDLCLDVDESEIIAVRDRLLWELTNQPNGSKE